MTRLRNHLFTFLALLGAAFLVIALDQDQRMDVPQDFGQRLMLPAETLFSSGTTSIGDFFSSVRDIGRLRSDNEIMRRQLDELSLVNVQVIELQQENERLRDLLGFPEQNPNYTLQVAEIVERETPAQVIGGEVSNLVQSIRINQGTELDIEPGMSVITARGLVGQVEDAGQGWAKVLLVTDQTSNVTAMVQQSRATGVVEGTGGGLVMRYIPHEQRVEPGDVVLSAGLGGQFPKGLVIGTVDSVERSDINPWQEAVIRPSTDFSEIEYVFVVRSFTELPEESP